MVRATVFVTVLVSAAGILSPQLSIAGENLPLRVAGFQEVSTDLPQPEALASELAALRERLDALEAQGRGDRGCFRSGWTAQVDYLNWSLRRGDLDFAIPTDDSTLAVGAGSVHRLEFGRDSGVRAGIGYRTRTGWELAFRYTRFHTSASASAEEPVGGNLWATRSHPNRNEEAQTATAQGSLDLDVFDLEAGHAFEINRFTSLRLFGGLRWANIDQALQFGYDGRDFDNGVVSLPVGFNGFGIPLGLEGRWRLCRGWSLFGRGTGSVMYGNFHSRMLETNVSGADMIVDVSDNYRQVVPVLEAAVGTSWRNDWLEVSGGYEFAGWLNLGNRSSFVNEQHEGLYVPEATDLLMDGLFIRCAVRR